MNMYSNNPKYLNSSKLPAQPTDKPMSLGEAGVLYGGIIVAVGIITVAIYLFGKDIYKNKTPEKPKINHTPVQVLDDLKQD